MSDLRAAIQALIDGESVVVLGPYSDPDDSGEEMVPVADLRAILATPAPDTDALAERPQIVCLCGSTRFYDAFQQANYDLTMRGVIVLSVGFYPHAKTEHGHGEGVDHDSVEKVALDKLHKRKIDLADEVLVLNIGGYVGESTRSEIEYAERIGCPVRYLEGGGRVAEESETHRVSPAPQGDAGSRERLDPLAATPAQPAEPTQSDAGEVGR